MSICTSLCWFTVISCNNGMRNIIGNSSSIKPCSSSSKRDLHWAWYLYQFPNIEDESDKSKVQFITTTKTERQEKIYNISIGQFNYTTLLSRLDDEVKDPHCLKPSWRNDMVAPSQLLKFRGHLWIRFVYGPMENYIDLLSHDYLMNDAQTSFSLHLHISISSWLPFYHSYVG